MAAIGDSQGRGEGNQSENGQWGRCPCSRPVGLSWASGASAPHFAETERPRRSCLFCLGQVSQAQKGVPSQKAADERAHTALSLHATWRNLQRGVHSGVTTGSSAPPVFTTHSHLPRWQPRRSCSSCSGASHPGLPPPAWSLLPTQVTSSLHEP